MLFIIHSPYLFNAEATAFASKRTDNAVVFKEIVRFHFVHHIDPPFRIIVALFLT